MTRQEINSTIYGEMLSLIACLSIYGGANPAPETRRMSPDEWMNVR